VSYFFCISFRSSEEKSSSERANAEGIIQEVICLEATIENRFRFSMKAVVAFRSPDQPEGQSAGIAHSSFTSSIFPSLSI
jgi:hypothetical protein